MFYSFSGIYVLINFLNVVCTYNNYVTSLFTVGFNEFS